MKRILLLTLVLAAFAYAADLQKFTGPAYKTATVVNTTQVYASVDARTSQVGAILGWASPGEVLTVEAVYSPFVKLQAKAASGWAWVELLSVTGDSAICDPSTEGRNGVALASQPNDYTTVNGALWREETAKVVDYWPRWVKVKFKGGVGYAFATEVRLAQ